MGRDYILSMRFTIPALLLLALGMLLATQSVFAQAGAPQAITVPPAPAAPTVVAVGTQTVELSWAAPAGQTVTVVGYKIERSTETPIKWVVVSANTGNDKRYYTDEDSSLAGKSVQYRITAINSVGVGLPSDPSTALALPTANGQPGMPINLKAKVSDTNFTTVALSWDAPSSQGSAAISGYTVQWSKDGNQPWTTFNSDTQSAKGTTTSHTGLTAGVTRHYRVAARNGNDATSRGPYSDSASVTLPPPGLSNAPSTAPVALAVGLQTVELTWASTGTTNGPIKGYKIERKIGSGEWEVAKTDTGSKNTYYSDTHSSLAGKSVLYRVAAINSVGTGPVDGASNSVTLPKSGKQPGAPTGLTVTPTTGTSVTVSWTAPSQGESAITGYTVQWSSDGNPTWTALSDTGTTTSRTDSITNGSTRHYRVAATNGQGTGPYSSVSSGKTIGMPGAPTSLSVAVVGTQTAELSWTAPADATIVGYKIERSTETPAKWVVVSANTRKDDTYYSDTHSSLAGKSVQYRVAAINRNGAGDYTAAAPDPAVALPTSGNQPGKPTNLKASLSPTTAGTVTLTWSAPTQGASEITGYKVRHSPNGKHTWTTVDHNSTSTTLNQSIGAGSTRHYRVAATNGQGTGPYSDIVSESTRPVGVPTVPQNLAAVAVGTQTVELSWTAPATPGGTIEGYKIQRNTGSGWVDVKADTGNDKLYYSDTHGSLAGKSVRYRVAAINGVGMGVYTAATPTEALALPKSGKQPGAPTGLTLTPTNSSNINISWTAPSSKGSPVLTGYHVQWSADGNQPWTDLTSGASPTTTSTTDTITQGVTRYYRVAARNGDTAADRGPYSDIVRLGGSLGEKGTVSLSTQFPAVAAAITATLTDADTPISNQSWMWQKSMSMDGDFDDIDGANSATYTPAVGDAGYYLRATVTYTDKYRSGNMAEATASNAVAATDEGRLLAAHDANNNGVIDKNEVVDAIEDYIQHGTITKDDVVTLIQMYLSS